MSKEEAGRRSMMERYASMDDAAMHKHHEELIRESWRLRANRPNWRETSPEDVNAYEEKVSSNRSERYAIEREKERRRRVAQAQGAYYKYFRDY